MSSLNVSSATQGLHEDMDMDVMSPQLHDHPYHMYHEPHQTTDASEGVNAVQEDSKSNLTPLQTVKQETINVQQLIEESIPNSVDQNKMILGFIASIPINDVPYNVTHEDIAKALSGSSDVTVSVRIMRKVIPCMKIIAYMQDAEFIGKKKIKGLWAQKPDDWPADVPYKDPNNGEKQAGRPVPKANSTELSSMFYFLKNKLMTKIFFQFKDLSEEQKEQQKNKGNHYEQKTPYSSYQFTTPSSGGKSITRATNKKHSSHPYPRPKFENHQSPSSHVPQLQVKQELPVTAPPSYSGQFRCEPSIPTFVASDTWEESGNNSPEQQLLQRESSPVTLSNETAQVVMEDHIQLSDSSEESSYEGDNYMEYYDEATGQRYIIQVVGEGGVDTSSTVSSDDSLNNSVPPMQEITEVREAQEVLVTPTFSDKIGKSENYQAPNEMQELITESGFTEKSKVPVQRQHSDDDKKPININRGPIQQVSSQHWDRTDYDKSPGRAEVSESIKTSMEPPSPHMTEYFPPSTIVHQPMSPYIGVLSPSPVSSPQYTTPDYNKTRLLQEMHDRLRSKLLTLQGMLLGEADIAVGLNKVYKSVVEFQYQKAHLGQHNQFIDAAHACEAILDRALMDGKNYSRDIFLRELDQLIEKYNVVSSSNPPQKTTVLHVTGLSSPPIQDQRYAELQQKQRSVNMLSPVILNPKSPGTALSEKMGKLGLEGLLSESDDPQGLGIRTRAGENVFEAMKGVVEPKASVPFQNPENDENFLSLPEKLSIFNVPADTETYNQKAVNDLLKQLNDVFAEKPEMDKLEWLDSEGDVDIKKKKYSTMGLEGDFKPETVHCQLPTDVPDVRPNIAISTNNDFKLAQSPITIEDDDEDDNDDLCIDEEAIKNSVLELEDEYSHYNVQWNTTYMPQSLKPDVDVVSAKVTPPSPFQSVQDQAFKAEATRYQHNINAQQRQARDANTYWRGDDDRPSTSLVTGTGDGDKGYMLVQQITSTAVVDTMDDYISPLIPETRSLIPETVENYESIKFDQEFTKQRRGRKRNLKK